MGNFCEGANVPILAALDAIFDCIDRAEEETRKPHSFDMTWDESICDIGTGCRLSRVSYQVYPLENCSPTGATYSDVIDFDGSNESNAKRCANGLTHITGHEYMAVRTERFVAADAWTVLLKNGHSASPPKPSNEDKFREFIFFKRFQ